MKREIAWALSFASGSHPMKRLKSCGRFWYWSTLTDTPAFFRTWAKRRESSKRISAVPTWMFVGGRPLNSSTMICQTMNQVITEAVYLMAVGEGSKSVSTSQLEPPILHCLEVMSAGERHLGHDLF